MINLKDNLVRSKYNDLANRYQRGIKEVAVNLGGSLKYGELVRVKDRLYLNANK